MTIADNLKRFLKCDYEHHFHVSTNGITLHNVCINHCLLYAFGQCTEQHTHICDECQKIFVLFLEIPDSATDSKHKLIIFSACKNLRNHIMSQAYHVKVNHNSNLLIPPFALRDSRHIFFCTGL